MQYLDLDGVRTAVRVTRAGEDGFDWVTPDGSQAGTMSRLPLYDEAGEQAPPDAEPSPDCIQRGLKLVVKTLAQTSVIAPEDALGIKELFDQWAVGLAVTAGAYYRYGDALYRVVRAHTTRANWTPDNALSPFTRIAPPDKIPAWSAGSWGLGVVVRHNATTWKSMVPNNVREPGAPGVYDNIWKEVTV